MYVNIFETIYQILLHKKNLTPKERTDKINKLCFLLEKYNSQLTPTLA